MSALLFLKYDCDAIQRATASALLSFWNANPGKITLKVIGREIEREASSVHEYISGGREMPMSCWLKLKTRWPELEDWLIFHLDEAEKAFRAKQRELRLPAPEPEKRVA